MEGIEHELERMEWYLMKTSHKTSGKNWNSWMKRTEKKMTTCATNEIESNLRRKDWMELLRKFNNEKNKLVVDLWITSQNYEVITNHNQKRLNTWEERRNAKLHFKRRWRINCTSKGKKERYLNSFDKNLDELLKKELNHEEPPWRTPVTKGWWDRMKDEKNKMSLAVI